jgi:hypothetical protein
MLISGTRNAESDSHSVDQLLMLTRRKQSLNSILYTADTCLNPTPFQTTHKLELQNLAHFTASRKILTSSQKNLLVSRISGFLTGSFASHLTIMVADRSIWLAI